MTDLQEQSSSQIWNGHVQRGKRLLVLLCYRMYGLICCYSTAQATLGELWSIWYFGGETQWWESLEKFKELWWLQRSLVWNRCASWRRTLGVVLCRMNAHLDRDLEKAKRIPGDQEKGLASWPIHCTIISRSVSLWVSSAKPLFR